MTKDQELLERIIVDPKIITGKSVIKGTRLAVGYILNLPAYGATTTSILDEYEGLTEADVQACILFATKCLEDAAFMPLMAESA